MQHDRFDPYATMIVYSGRPNPCWQISVKEWEQLSKLIDSLSKVLDNDGKPYQFHGHLGYSGFHAHFSIISSYPDIYYVAEHCQVVLSNPGGYMIFADEQKQVETWFMDSAKNHGITLPSLQ